jgi:AraC-like DNA-binding protein
VIVNVPFNPRLTARLKILILSIMRNPNYMIDSPAPSKPDRLSAFFRAFDFTAVAASPEGGAGDATLTVKGAAGAVRGLVLAIGPADAAFDSEVLAAVSVSFGGPLNPLLSALPERIEIELDDAPDLRALASVFAAEARDARCGKQTALARLAEVIVLMVLRRTIDAGTTQPGLLAGLSHPALHRALAAIHDAPARPWRIEDLAALAGVSRSRFMELFRDIVGVTPSSYLAEWRLALARRALADGERVKAIAARVGFGSAAAFSRAYTRRFGHPPVQARLH